MDDAPPAGSKQVIRNLNRADDNNASWWTFHQTPSGMCLAVLDGGGRKLSVYLYPSEFQALRAACSYDLWDEEAKE